MRSIAACSKVLDGDYVFAVAVGSLCGDPIFEDERTVVGNPLEQTRTCTCGQFERIGLLCAHALSVFDLMNIKLLPPHYILKHWTLGARCGTIQDRSGRNVVENPMLDAILSCKFLTHKFVNLATQALSSQQCRILLDNALDILSKKVEEQLKKEREGHLVEECDTQVVPQE